MWRFQVLDGAMACPPEDSSGFEGMGNGPYQDFLNKVLAARYKSSGSQKYAREYKKLCKEASTALNYGTR